MDELTAIRHRYARMVLAAAGSSDQALEQAFATVPRERFVGTRPWLIEGPLGFVTVSGDDPSVLYGDILVSLSAPRGINNGQPSLHARCLAALRVQPGETVVHVGAGTGYYTAILAALVGPVGWVHAYEIESDLAAIAESNLAAWPHVAVHAASACEGALPAADVVYVNAGATHPLDAWLDALVPGGRLLFPLTSDDGVGSMLLVTHFGAGHYAARFMCRVSFIPCQGARSPRDAQAIAAAFGKGKMSTVQSLRRHTPPDGTAWCVGTGWWLSTAQVAREDFGLPPQSPPGPSPGSSPGDSGRQ